MVTYTKHTPTKKVVRTSNSGAAFGFYLRTGVPYNPRMTDKERKTLMRR